MLQIVRLLLLLAYLPCCVGEKSEAREMIRRDSTTTSTVCERERRERERERQKLNLTNIGICMQVTLPVREHHHLVKYASCNNRRERRERMRICLFFWSSIRHVSSFFTFSRFDSSSFVCRFWLSSIDKATERRTSSSQTDLAAVEEKEEGLCMCRSLSFSTRQRIRRLITLTSKIEQSKLTFSCLSLSSLFSIWCEWRTFGLSWKSHSQANTGLLCVDSSINQTR